MKQHLRSNSYLYALILLCIISRLPQMLSPYLLLDGDEAIIGLMAKHFVHGKNFPVFFYGQQYGFVLFEVAAVAIGLLIGGVSTLAVKLPVFALWIAGIIFFYKALLAISKGNRSLAFFFTAVLVLCPAWAAWAMKARGGYITAFTLTNMLLYLLLDDKQVGKKVIWAFIGASLVVIFYAQPLWLPGLMPFLLWRLFKRQHRARFLQMCIAAVPLIIFFLLAKEEAPLDWKPQVFSIPDWHRIAITPGYIYDNLTGYYYLQRVFEAPIEVQVYPYVFIVLMILSLIVALIYLLATKKGLLLLTALSSVLLTLGYLVAVDITSPRYALPLAGFAVLLIAVVVHHAGSFRKTAYVICFPLLLCGGAAVYSFQHYKFAHYTPEDIMQVVAYAEEDNITHVFPQGGQLQWQIVFYSDEKLIPRWLYPVDRYMPYVHAVDSVYSIAPEHTAFIGMGIKAGKYEEEIQVNNKFFIYKQPDKAYLRSQGFSL